MAERPVAQLLTLEEEFDLLDAELAVRQVAESLLVGAGGIVIMPDLDPVPVAPPEDDETQFDAVMDPETPQDRIRRLMQLYDGKLLK